MPLPPSRANDVPLALSCSSGRAEVSLTGSHHALRRANPLKVTDLCAGAAGNATTQIHNASQRRGGMATPGPSRVGCPDASDRHAERELLIQSALINLGYLDPPVDSGFGPVTKWAVRTFAERAGLDSGDKITPELVRALQRGDPLPLAPGDDLAGRIVKAMQKNNYWIADVRSPGSRARSVRTCQCLRPRRAGWALAISRPSVLPSVSGTTSAPGKRVLSRLNGWPVRSPVNASPMPSRAPAHDSGSMRFATSSS
jgi:Putative peptidoglycan binding domain